MSSELERMTVGCVDELHPSPSSRKPKGVLVGPAHQGVVHGCTVVDGLFPQVFAAIAAISAPASSAAQFLQASEQLLSTRRGRSHSSAASAATSRSPSSSSSASQTNCLELHTAGQISGAFGVTPKRASRFNAGAFVLDTDARVDPPGMALRLKALFTSAPDAHLARVLYSARRTGGLPLRLLQPVAPWLDGLLRMRLSTSRSDALLAYTDTSGNASPEAIYDGCHLGIVGFAAALVAWADDDTLVITPPPHCIVSAPGIEAEGSSATKRRQKRSTSHSPAAATPTCVNADTDPPRSQPPAAQVAGLSCCSLGTLFQRWPHLPRLMDAADDDVVEQCRILTRSLHEGAIAFPGTSICDLFADHLLACDTPCMVSVHGEAGGPPLFKSMNQPLVDLLGFSTQDPFLNEQQVAQTELTAGMARLPPLRWLHPECMLKRTLAFLAAQNAGLRSFQVEVRYLRALGSGAATFSNPEHVSGKSDEYVSVFAIETCHLERHADGRLLAFSSYLSDVVHCSQPERLSDAQLQAAELDVIDTLVLQRDQLPLEMSVAMRRLNADPAIVLAQCISDRVTAGLFVAMANLALVPQHDSAVGSTGPVATTSGTLDTATPQLSSGFEGPCIGAGNPQSASSSVCSPSGESQPAAPVTPAAPASHDSDCSSIDGHGLDGAGGVECTDSAGLSAVTSGGGGEGLQNRWSVTQAELQKRVPQQHLEQLFNFVCTLVRRCQVTPMNLVTRVGSVRLCEPHPLQTKGACLDMLQLLRHPRNPSLSLMDVVGEGLAGSAERGLSQRAVNLATANNMAVDVTHSFPG